MSTDDMNPFMNSSTHSTWPIVLMILSLPPWLCNKQKYIMMSRLISWSQQPGNDIDTYFRALVKYLNELWYNDRVQVWDEHKREAIMNFCNFFNAIGQKVPSEEALKSLEKRHYETLCVLEMYFPPAFFDISVHLTTHLIKEIKLLVPVFLYQMYVYKRFNGIRKTIVRNRACPKSSMVQGYYREEGMEWALNYADPSNPIGVFKSHHEGRLTGKGTIGKKAITPDPH
jgi:hypothetical protein